MEIFIDIFQDKKELDLAYANSLDNIASKFDCFREKKYVLFSPFIPYLEGQSFLFWRFNSHIEK